MQSIKAYVLATSVMFVMQGGSTPSSAILRTTALSSIPSSPVLPTEAPRSPCARKGGSSPLDWVHHQGYCYTYYDSEIFTWGGAKMFCQDNGAFLVSIHSLDEMNFIIQLSSKRKDYRKRTYWIGLRARGLHSSYRWDDGTPLNFVNWEDEDSYDESSSTDTCVILDLVTATWKKHHCNFLGYTICKAEDGTEHTFSTPVPTPAIQGYCPDGWYTWGNKCYKVFGRKQARNWSEAKNECKEIDSQLVSIHSQEEQDFVTLLLLPVRLNTWIGLYSTIGGRLFHWTDNSSIVYTNWDSNQPDFHKGEEECGHMWFHGRTGKWNDNLCSLKFSFICQMQKDPMLTKPGEDPFFCTEPKSWIKVGSSCYQAFNGSQNSVTWIQAQEFCLRLDSNLATIRYFADTVFLRRHLEGSTGLFWIGMKEMNQRSYRWIGASDIVYYTNWLQHQPSRVSRFDNCVAINADGRWMVRNCKENHPFICEEIKESPTVAPYDPDLICPKSTGKWKDLGGKLCYRVETEKQLTWHQAVHKCFAIGGRLISIHSDVETEAILQLIKGSSISYHIGLAQMEDGRFAWLDGSAVDYINWEPGEPNDGYTIPMCTEIRSDSGAWDDIPCTFQRGYICSTDKVPRSVSTTNEAPGDQVLRSVSTPNAAPGDQDHKGGLTAGIAIGTVLLILLLIAVAGLAFYYFRFSERMKAKRQTEPIHLRLSHLEKTVET